MNAIKTILIIEDNEESLFLYGEILRAENLNIVDVLDATSALTFLNEKHIVPDLIIMDLSFPHMSAEEFVQTLRNGKSDWLEIPILVISGHLDTQERARALNANGFLRKPFDLDQFLNTIKALVHTA